MKPQTTPQILLCLALGGYTARVEGDGLRIRGPQPLADALPESIGARRGEVVGFLNEWCGGARPAAPGSGLREVERVLGGGLGAALEGVEAESEGAA